MKKRIISIMLIILILSTNMLISFAVTQSDINEIKNQQSGINDKIEEREKKQAKVGEQIKETNKQIQKLTSQISEYKDQIEELDIKLSDLEKSISETQIKLEEAEKKYVEQEESLQARIVAQYEFGEITYLDVLLGEGSLWDMISNWQMVSDVAEMDNRLLEQIEKNRAEIEEAKKSLETSKEQVVTIKQNKESTAAALASSQSQKEKEVSKLNQEDKELQAEIDELTNENNELTRKLRQKEREYQQQLNNLSNGTTKPTGGSGAVNLGGSGVLQRPVKSGVITATMYYSSGVYHGALDYGIPVGTTVYSAADGVVLHAGWRTGGLGYCVIIQHTNGLRTFYGHGNGTIYVKEGDVVARGEPIMLSGNTGNSTGPHLHFEVRVSPYSWSYGGGNGDCRRDPRNYL